MTEIINHKQYDLEERTSSFARQVRDYVKSLPRTLSNIEYARQLIRSSGSVAANYIEANESLSKKDFNMRIKICRKEAKDSRLWLGLAECSEKNIGDKDFLMQESREFVKIFNSICEKSR